MTLQLNKEIKNEWRQNEMLSVYTCKPLIMQASYYKPTWKIPSFDGLGMWRRLSVQNSPKLGGIILSWISPVACSIWMPYTKTLKTTVTQIQNQNLIPWGLFIDKLVVFLKSLNTSVGTHYKCLQIK